MKYLFLVFALAACSSPTTSKHPCPAGKFCHQGVIKATCKAHEVPIVMVVMPDRDLLKGCNKYPKFSQSKMICKRADSINSAAEEGRVVYYYNSNQYVKEFSQYEVVPEPKEVYFCPTAAVDNILDPKS